MSRIGYPKSPDTETTTKPGKHKDLPTVAFTPTDHSAAQCAAVEAWLLTCPCDLTADQKRQVWRVFTAE